ncbi:MAG: hypothetical protein C0394_08475 [Syntrophus sp. (in: bacteria)]|nr:hypothetical protein [Syntrophus sp. (in: bacteria)]
MKSDDDKPMPHEQEPFTVGGFRPEDADGIVRLFRAVYGEGYPIRLFYDPAAITAANREGRYYSIVARAPAGEIVGATHLYNSAAPCKVLYEWGAGLVLKEYRNLGVNSHLGAFLLDNFITRNPHIEEVFGEPVCNHPVLQKAVIPLKFIETAIEVALMPAEAYSREKSAAGRVATLTAFRCYKPKPHRIFLPPAYEQELRGIYARLDDARDVVVSEGEIPGARPTKADLTVFDFARVARIAVPETGGDFSNRLAVLEGEALLKNTVVFQVWLNLTEPWAGAAVDILRDRGYFFGGALPRWFDGDGFLMQKLLCPPDFESIVLVSDFAKQLLEFIKQDWRRAASRQENRPGKAE